MKNRPRRWHRVETDELREVWKSLTDRNICYCGCTHVELEKRYPGRLKHRMGHGWYKLV